MRSRYSAFVRGRPAHLLATWHHDTRPATLDPDPPGLRWLGLEVRGHADAGRRPRHRRVRGPQQAQGRAHRLHETSRFVRLDGRWHYLDGDVGLIP